MSEWINNAFRIYLHQRYRQIIRYMEDPHNAQREVWRELMMLARHTEWGRTHGYADIRTPESFARRVPIQDYESLKPYIHRMMHGVPDVLCLGGCAGSPSRRVLRAIKVNLSPYLESICASAILWAPGMPWRCFTIVGRMPGFLHRAP